ncbi:MAG: hypothetical protein ABI742_05145 [Gemmatimonadota bacterium]
MSHRLQRLALVVCLAGAGLAAAGARFRSPHGPHDLDSYSDAQLKRDLDDELDDIYAELGDADGEYNLDVLKEDILAALGDDGDSGYEDEIDYADLEDEMKEDGTTLEDVVDDALAKADELGSAGAPVSLFHYASFSATAQKRDKSTTAAIAVRETERAIIFNIRRAK